MNDGGYNPLRWDCEKRGCFNKKYRPKIEEFADCFPNNIGVSDIDGIVEIEGHFLIQEWKSFIGDIPTGQKIMFERMTRNKNFTVVIIAGDAATMEIFAIKAFRDGKQSDWHSCSLEELKGKMRHWVTRVKTEGKGF